MPTPENITTIYDLETVIEDAVAALFTELQCYVTTSHTDPTPTPALEEGDTGGGDPAPTRDFEEKRPRVDITATIGASLEHFAPVAKTPGKRINALWGFNLTVVAITNALPRSAHKQFRSMVRHVLAQAMVSINGIRTTTHYINALVESGTDRDVNDKDNYEATRFNFAGKISVHTSTWDLLGEAEE